MTITPNFIEIYDDVLSEEQCKQIITEFELDKIFIDIYLIKLYQPVAIYFV